jgi:GTPase SAR1 family protein
MKKPGRNQRSRAGEMAGGSEITVAVMGMTGAGKSSFIERLTLNKSIVVGNGLESGMYIQI